MLTELDVLRALLLLSMLVAPLATRRLHGAPARLHTAAHLGALGCAAAGLFSSAPVLCVAWLAFCAASGARFLWTHRRSLLSLRVVVAGVPFVFSGIAALWLVAGANDLRLLGYGPHFSYYAALHGNVLGWTLIGALAVLADQDGPRRGVYRAAVLVCLASFLAIALGIDQLRALKPIGVTGLSLALLAAYVVFLRGAWARSALAFGLGCVSLAGLLVTMGLAWGHELARPVLVVVAGFRGMVLVHGVLNAVVVAPCLLLAVLAATPARHRD